MAGEYTIGSQVDGYGSPGASALFGVQQELMRRAQLEQEARVRAEALARQQQQDELQRQRTEQEIAASKSNVAANEDVRKANADAARDRTLAAGTKQVTESLTAGQDVTPDQVQAATKLVGPERAALLFAKKPAQPGTAPLQDGDQGPEMPATPEKTTYAGTDAQRQAEAKKVQAQAVLNGDYDTGNESVDMVEHARAQHFLNTGKDASATDIAGVLKAQNKGDKPESKGQRDAEVEKVFYDRAIAAGASPADATIQARTAYNKLAGAEASQRIHFTVDQTDARQNKTLTNSAVQHEADAVQKKIEGLKLPQAANMLETLNSPGGVNDVVAVPEFLSAMAGGVGRGLRMSQAELNMIQQARPGTESLAIKLQNLASGYTALTPEQRASMMTLIRAVATREAKMSDNYILTQAKVNSAKSPEEARGYINKMNAEENAMYKGMLGLDAKPAGTSKFTATIE